MSGTHSAREEIYPLPYAAQLAGLDVGTARRWMRGYEYQHKGQTKHSAPVLHMVSESEAQRNNLSFEDLLTLRLVRAFREDARLGLPTIKAAARIAATRYGVTNPFVNRMFRSDGRKVFLELQDSKLVRGKDRMLVEAITGQQQFREVVEPSLFRNIVFVRNEPSIWHPQGNASSVVIRPDRAFGAPHVADTGVRTDVLADAVKAEGGDVAAVAAVAEWFKLKPKQVEDAVAAEGAWRSRAAS